MADAEDTGADNGAQADVDAVQPEATNPDSTDTTDIDASTTDPVVTDQYPAPLEHPLSFIPATTPQATLGADTRLAQTSQRAGQYNQALETVTLNLYAIVQETMDRSLAEKENSLTTATADKTRLEQEIKEKQDALNAAAEADKAKIQEEIAKKQKELNTASAVIENLPTEIADIKGRKQRLQSAVTPLKNQGADGEWDALSDTALSALIQELQRGGLGYVMPDGNIITTGWNRNRDGGYSQTYHDYLEEQIDKVQSHMDALIEKQKTTPLTNAEIQDFGYYKDINETLTPLFNIMHDMKKQGAINFAPNQPSIIDKTNPDMPTIDYNEALTIVDTALKSMNDLSLNHFNPPTGDASYELASRRATQAFIIQLASDFNVKLKDGRYNVQTRLELSNILAKPENRETIKNKYFNGDEGMTERILLALNTLATKQPLAQDGKPAPVMPSIITETLIYKPEFQESEIKNLDISITHVPADELPAIAHFSRIMTGFGLEDLMPEGHLTDDQKQAIESVDSAQAFSELYTKIHAEIARENPNATPEQMKDKITSRIVQNFNEIYDDIPAYDFSHKVQLRANIRSSVETAVDKFDSESGTETEKLAAAGAAFAGKIPTYEQFIDNNGLGHREKRASFSAPDMQPTFIANGIANQNEQQGVQSRSLDQGPTIDSMINQISQSYNQGTFYEFEDHAGFTAKMQDHFPLDESAAIAHETLTKVKADLENIKTLITETYGDKTNPLVIKGKFEETYLASRNNGEVEIRYLGKGEVPDISAYGTPITINEQLNIEKLVNETALAAYQARNGAYPTEYASHLPVFFKMDDKFYVGGMNKQSGTFEVHEMNPDFINDDNARIISHNRPGENINEAYAKLMEKDDAYKFLRQNYSSIMYGGNDYIFNRMALFIGTPAADKARTILNMSFENGIATQAQEEAQLKARQNTLENATPPDLNPEIIESNHGPRKFTNISFIMDQNPNDPNGHTPGVWIQSNDRDHEDRNIEISPAQKQELENALGINFDEQMRAAFGDQVNNSFKETDTSRFFIFAIHPEHPKVQGGLVIGYMDSNNEIRYGYVKSNEYDLNRYLELSDKLSAQYISKNEQGYDRLHIHPKEGFIINNHRIQSVFVNTDGAVSEPDNFLDTLILMNNAGWIEGNAHGAQDKKAPIEDQSTPENQNTKLALLRDNSAYLSGNMSLEIADNSSLRQPTPGNQVKFGG